METIAPIDRNEIILVAVALRWPKFLSRTLKIEEGVRADRLMSVGRFCQFPDASSPSQAEGAEPEPERYEATLRMLLARLGGQMVPSCGEAGGGGAGEEVSRGRCWVP